MKQYQKEIIKLSAKQVLCIVSRLALPFFEASSIYRVPARQFKEEVIHDMHNFSCRLHYLKRQGLIETFVEGKDKYYEITSRGQKYIEVELLIEETKKHNSKWDGKWRIVIFDIPEKRKQSRDVMRDKLISVGFIRIQENVYAFPFECTQLVELFSDSLGVSKNVLIMISDIIQGEDIIIKNFIDKGILEESDLKK